MNPLEFILHDTMPFAREVVVEEVTAMMRVSEEEFQTGRRVYVDDRRKKFFCLPRARTDADAQRG